MAARLRRAAWAAVLAALGGGAAGAEPLTIFAAASTTEVMTEIAARFERTDGTETRSNFAASSTLARQILGGAPADLYLSADTAWMDHLAAARAIDEASRRVLFANRLILATRRDRPSLPPPVGAAFLEALGDERLAIGDPAHVPAGRYAEAALRHLGLWSALAGRTVPTGSVREALALLARAEVAGAIVYATDAGVASGIAVAYRFPAAAHPPIVYPVALVRGRTNAAAERLMTFLLSEAAREIYVRHGFQPAGGGG